MKRKIILFILAACAILSNITLLYAAGLAEIFDSTNSKGIDVDLENNLFTFSESGGSLYLLGNDGNIHTYSNIAPATENINSFIQLNLDGSIESLDLTAIEETSIYINGAYIPLNKGSNAIYNNGKLEIISNSDGNIKTPTLSESIFSSTPKEIMYTSLNGADLRLSKDYSLKGGSLKYSFDNKEFYVPQGQVSILNDFNIDAQSSNVILNKNIRFTGTSAISSGSGFKISFNSGTSTFLETGETSISLNEANNGKYFQVGDTGSDVSQIQKIVGLHPTGKYDEITKQAVMKWQGQNGLAADGLFGENSLNRANSRYTFDLSQSANGNYYSMGDKGENVKTIQSFLVSEGYLEPTFTNSYGKQVNSVDGIYGTRTAEAVLNWQKSIGASYKDGKFGEESVKYAGNYGNNVVVSMNGGSSVISNGKNGLDISLKGRTILEVGGEKYYFDGGDLKKSLWPTLQSNVVSTPTKVTFVDENGKEFELNLDTADTKVNSIDVGKAAGRAGIKASSVSCSGTTQATCSLMIEQDGGGFFRVPSGLSAQKAGVIGNAWEMQENILDEGGKIVYSKENQLTLEQKSKLVDLEKTASSNIEKYMKQGLSKEEAIKKASSDIRAQLGNILNNDQFSSQISAVKGDVVSLYYRDSNYLSEALTEGDNNQKNTHVGIIVGSTNTYATLSSDENVLAQLKSKLGITNGNSLYVNSYSYIDEQGYLEPLTLQDDKFYVENGQEFTFSGTQEIVINRPELAHMIHYSGETNPYHVESLDSVISKSDLSLYGVTRPQYTDYLNEFFNFPDSATASQNSLNCKILNCKGFTFTQALQANNIKDYEEWGSIITQSTIERQKEYNINENLMDEFNAITAGIINRESTFGDSTLYKLETATALIQGKSSVGYMQVQGGSIAESAYLFDDEIPSNREMYTNKETSIKYGQRHLAEAFNIYTEAGQTTLTENQVKVIAAAYNSGYYTPRNAAVQKQLSELGYYDAKTDGLWGSSIKEALIQFAQENKINYQSISETTFATEAFEDTTIYKAIVKKYKEETGNNPEYAIVPDITTKSIKTLNTKVLTTFGYANEVYEQYQNFCPTCN